MKIRVTEDDITRARVLRKGDRQITEICPIALACKRQLFEWVEHVRVGVDTINFKSGNSRDYIVLPEKAKRFIEIFDQLDMPVSPFEFNINSEEIEKPVKITLDEPTEPLECELVKV